MVFTLSLLSSWNRHRIGEVLVSEIYVILDQRLRVHLWHKGILKQIKSSSSLVLNCLGRKVQILICLHLLISITIWVKDYNLLISVDRWIFMLMYLRSGLLLFIIGEINDTNGCLVTCAFEMAQVYLIDSFDLRCFLNIFIWGSLIFCNVFIEK
jgi:hypothetical protein